MDLNNDDITEGQDIYPDSGTKQPSAPNENDTPVTAETDVEAKRRIHPQKGYQEATVYNKEINIPGPNELPDQQKVGESGD